MLWRELRPNRVEGLQPSKQQRILRSRNRPSERLVEMVVGVHKARRHNASLRMNDLSGCCQISPDGNDRAVTYQNVCVR